MACPPAMLMCRPCWRLVPGDLQRKVYATVGRRSRSSTDATWAPWWRAQARATHAVLKVRRPDDENVERYLARELEFADTLASKR